MDTDTNARALKHSDSFLDTDRLVEYVKTVTVPGLGVVDVPVVKGNLAGLTSKVQQFIARYVALCEPKGIYICDGSRGECEELTQKLVDRGTLIKLDKMDNCYVCRTDPADVARVEGKTFLVTEKREDSVPHVRDGVKGILGQWMSPETAEKELGDRFPGCMTGRVMYVIAFSMGPVGGPLSKIGVQLTDSNYVVLSMRIMTRESSQVWKILSQTGEFVECVHSIGAPRPLQRKLVSHWPCDPEHVLICQYPKQRKIVSYGSCYGGNSLLGKKCFALRIASRMAKEEGWLAEHMLLMSVTNPEGEEKFIAAAFPSACGKTNMAMMTPKLPGWKVLVLGDDIVWMRFHSDGTLRAINPEAGFFGVAPGTNLKTNPIAMETVSHDSIFTNVAMTEDGYVYWEGLENEVDPHTHIINWLGEEWHVGMSGRASHPNSRFCCPASGCPIIHPKWEDPEGVPISAIIFGGRRPEGVPLVLESYDWKHGVMVGAALKSESTAAAEHKGKQIMHDPMAMRPFMGYNFGQYLQHWLDLEQPGRQMPKIFQVNWFRRDDKGKFLWPGFGDNIRVLDWICRRIDNQDIAVPSPIGLLPKKDTIDLNGLNQIDWEELFRIPKAFWEDDIRKTKQFMDEQVGCDLPETIAQQLDDEENRIKNM